MISLLIAVGALFLAVLASVILDPWPSRTEDADERAPTTDAIVLSL
jgi:hypothetical protein